MDLHVPATPHVNPVERANLAGGVNSMNRSEKESKNRCLLLFALIPVFLLTAVAHAQQTTGVPCSPSRDHNS